MKRLMLVLLLLCTSKIHAQLSFGFTYEYLSDGVEVKVVFKNSPAEKAGLKEGDIILMVNDTVMRMVARDRMANVFATAPATSKFLLGYYGEDDELYRGKTCYHHKRRKRQFFK